MNIDKVLMEYDNMFGICSLEEIENFLTKKLDEAYGEGDNYSAITLINELMGFCRDTHQKDKGIKYCEEVMNLMERMSLQGTVEHATTMLNVANAYRAFGKCVESQNLYCQVEKIYNKKLALRDFNYASLYNNWSLLYQEVGDYPNAKIMLEKALVIVDTYPNAKMEQATTRTNLATTLLRMYQLKDAAYEEYDHVEKDSVNYEDLYKKATAYLKQSLSIYEADGGRDFHYSGALSAMGDACYMKKDYLFAMDYYDRALKEIEKHVGRTESYRRVEDNYNRAQKMYAKEKSVRQVVEEELKMKKTPTYHNNMDRCKAFYEKYGRDMIRDKFPEYEKKIAVGLVGEGSDCFGYDDGISMDHDYGVGFCMWLTGEDYGAIGGKLKKEYEILVKEYSKEFFDASMEENARISFDNRRGVFEIYNFYDRILNSQVVRDFHGFDKFILPEMWETISEDNLATATNGQVFRDDFGRFTAIRKELMGYYPKQVWYIKLAGAVHTFSQNGQYNYPRMMARKDYVTASICKSQAMRAAMSIVYLLNNKFAPYYKWMFKGIKGLNKLSQVSDLLEEAAGFDLQKAAWEDKTYNPYESNLEDEVVANFEKIARLILNELKCQNITMDNDIFLDKYTQEIYQMSEEYKNRTRLINQIIESEWEQFDDVKNEGGRADCQDDWNTFSIMRKSQYDAWPYELLESYNRDLIRAEDDGRNLIMEKYARMMKSTVPERYAEFEKDLPVFSPERIAIQEEIIKIQVDWMEEFASKYPKMAGNARSIHTSEDTPYNTSYETYLRGELCTYSENTLVLYGRFVVQLSNAGGNLAYNIMNNTALLYGYGSVEEAESRL